MYTCIGFLQCHGGFKSSPHDSANSANTFSDVIKETNFYYFVYSTHTLNYETKVSLQVHGYGIYKFKLVYSLEESNIYSKFACTIVRGCIKGTA